MCTPVSPVDFETELLLDSGGLATGNTSIHEDVYVNQNLDLLESTEQVSVQNERDAEHKAEHLKIPNSYLSFEEPNKDELQRCIDEKNHEEMIKDIDELKQQYMKVLQDYTELQAEHKQHALNAMNANALLKKERKKLNMADQKLNALENQYHATNALYKASLSESYRLTKLLLKKLESEAASAAKIQDP